MARKCRSTIGKEFSGGGRSGRGITQPERERAKGITADPGLTTVPVGRPLARVVNGTGCIDLMSRAGEGNWLRNCFGPEDSPTGL